MKLFQIFIQIIILYGFFLVGKMVQETFQLFIPGSIIGMFLFFLALITKLIPTKWFENGVELLLKHMPLMFLPVTAGIIVYLPFFQGKDGLQLTAIILVSTFVVMLSSAFVGQKFVHKKER